ncbi:MAG: YggS family pyridoxal phosphate-dependent enzyme [Tissierellia bacterium]|nr:YggS family pyridoxal phosphate-dependent enzyme [Tissierellia bacterium]
MSIQENLNHVWENIEQSAAKSGRTKEDITLIAVTKTISMNRILEATKLGIKDIGENRPQEIQEKIDFIPENIHLHMIGQLQTNKVKYIIGGCSLIHSLDRLSLLREIDKRGKSMDKKIHTLIQINHTTDENRGGIPLSGLEDFLGCLSEYPNVFVDGLMCVASLTEDETKLRTEFSSMRKALEDLKKYETDNFRPTILSMGMSHDYKIAIEEGATHVRIGSAIFGDRTRR